MSLPPALEGLAVTAVRAHCVATTDFRADNYAGFLLRGGFGFYLRELACITQAASCEGCPHQVSCVYRRVFETPVDEGRDAILRSGNHAPHPFVLVPEQRCDRVPRGSGFSLRLMLFGTARQFLPHFVVTLERMGQSGRFGGRFRIQAATAASNPDVVVYDGSTRRFTGADAVVPPPMSGNLEKKMRLSFTTPLRLQTGGRPNFSPSFVDLTHGLLRRLHFLSVLYGNTDPASRWRQPYMESADRIRVERSEFRPMPMTRFSGRQLRRIPMPCVKGRMEVSGELAELRPLFEHGQWFHIGSGTSMGLGSYRVEEIPE